MDAPGAADREQVSAVPAQSRIPALVWAAQGVCAAVAVCWVRASGFSCMSRPAVEHNGYTCFHLPGLNLKPDEPRKDDAIFAILAARIAFSSFDIRSRLR